MGNNEFNRDLDIFGGSDDGMADEGGDMFGGDESTMDESSMDAGGIDMFGAEDTEEEVVDETTTEDESTEEASEAGEEEMLEEATDASEVEAEMEETPEADAEDYGAVDAEVLRLLEELETENSSADPDEDVMEDILNDMRMKVAESATETAFVKKQNESLQQRLMEYASKDIDQGVNQPLISKVEADPKLRALIHLSGNTDDASKEKFTRIMGDMYSEMTGIDIAELIEREQNSKAAAALGGGSGKGGSPINTKMEEETLTAEESMNNLW